jgi:hypothetical protein
MIMGKSLDKLLSIATDALVSPVPGMSPTMSLSGIETKK